MRLSRGQTLAAGTVLIISICYAVAAPSPRQTSSVRKPATPRAEPADDADLSRRCDALAENLKSLGQEDWAIQVHSPFVLAGDLTVEQLQDVYQGTILPARRVLEIDYFDHEPVEPIAILMLSSDEAFREALRHFSRSRRMEYSGLYHREQRTILLNLETGLGTVTHELTHALAHADFPEMPEWFDEGLASLHEESRFSLDGRHLLGCDNWRVRFLQEADQRGCWKSVSELLDEPFARPDVAALDYALARYFCLYLQEQGLLPAYYRKCRSLGSIDSTGRAALLKIHSGKTLDALDREFRAWVLQRN